MIKWLENDVPLSGKFDDTYYTKSDGRAETEHVYIQGNNLPERWLKSGSMTIGELGFGTGLNFLETVRQWELARQPSDMLHFISFEQYPLTRLEITQALSRWSILSELTTKLCDLWKPDCQRLEVEFFSHVKLTVEFGDANMTLPLIKDTPDAWYLDGFSPAKNPQLWNLELMQQVYDHTKPSGTFATYTVAGYVRRNLQQAGFTISRQKGFGSKREMLVGRKT